MRPALAASLLLLAALLCADVGEGQKSEVRSETLAAPVLLLPGGREHFALRLEVSGDPSPTAEWEAFLERLFDHFDRDGDGWLSRAEAGRIMPLPLPGGKELVIDFDRLDTDHNGKGSRAELKAYCRQNGFAPVVLVVLPPSADDARLAHLFLHQLDANGDGKLSLDELRRAPRALRRYDLNEDETLDLTELLTAGSTHKPGPSQLQVGTASAKDAALRIAPGAKPGATLHGTGAREAHLVTPSAGVQRLRGPAARWWLTVRAERSMPAIRSASEFLLSQFRDALGDNKSLSKAALEEDAALSGFLDLFPCADRDGDGRLTLAELESYLRLVEMGVRAQVWVTAADRGQNPFHFLDRDGDGRLSWREQLLAADLLGGQAEMVGLPGQFDLSLGGPAVKSWGGVAVPAVKRLPGKAPVAVGPAWFRAMDRNGDGVVSRAEFLGPPELFRELDADGDGVISVEEATRADGARPGPGR
jgi:Ca2+-binding EF-hand superfamily protein